MAETNPSFSINGKVPLVIGVSGHRDIHSSRSDSLYSGLVELYSQLKSSYRHSPIVLLALLAEGADRLAARAALEPLQHSPRCHGPIACDEGDDLFQILNRFLGPDDIEFTHALGQWGMSSTSLGRLLDG